jgi:hypothetical protein
VPGKAGVIKSSQTSPKSLPTKLQDVDVWPGGKKIFPPGDPSRIYALGLVTAAKDAFGGLTFINKVYRIVARSLFYYQSTQESGCHAAGSGCSLRINPRSSREYDMETED